ncbi:phasin family protein [Cupriavidus oxalaticus]|uniref:phasin family protein n=1 Tax=Cupriavidus oxalaticus TaxID=96344 RepID=UPI003177D50B
METTNPTKLFSEYTKVLERFKLPGLDFAAIRESRRKDLAALTTVNLTLLDGVQAFGQKQADIARGALSELQTRLLQKAEAGTPVAGNVELARHALQKALANLRELADIAQKAQADSVAVASKRLAENVEELKALFKPAH